MGGKSRKGGQPSKRLINRLMQQAGLKGNVSNAPSCGGTVPRKRGKNLLELEDEQE